MRANACERDGPGRDLKSAIILMPRKYLKKDMQLIRTNSILSMASRLEDLTATG